MLDMFKKECKIQAVMKVKPSILDRVFDPIGRCLTPAVARKLVRLRADPDLQARIGDLAEKCNDGRMSKEERAEYESYVRAVHFLTVLQSKARARLGKAPSC